MPYQNHERPASKPVYGGARDGVLAGLAAYFGAWGAQAAAAAGAPPIDPALAAATIMAVVVYARKKVNEKVWELE